MSTTVYVTETEVNITETNDAVNITIEESTPEVISMGDVILTGSPGVFTNATKASAVDAGVKMDLAFDDDYLYICTVTGSAGSATWKKTPLLRT